MNRTAQKTEKKKTPAEARASAKKWSEKRRRSTALAVAAVGGNEKRAVHALPHTSKQSSNDFTSDSAMIFGGKGGKLFTKSSMKRSLCFHLMSPPSIYP